MVPSQNQTPQGVRIGNIEFLWARNSKEFFFSNSILIHDSKLTVVDPSANFSFLEPLAARKQVAQVINTHYHVDHRSLNSLFRQHAIYLCHPLDEPYMSIENYLKSAEAEKASGYVDWLRGIFASLDLRNPYFHPSLEDKTLVPLEDNEVQVIHLPGHTPGHIGLFFHDIDLLFVSDVDLTPLGPWYANIPSSIEDFLTSLERLKNFSCQYYVSSHGARVYDREQFLKKLARFREAFDLREEKLLETLKDHPQSLEELSQVGIIYKKLHLEKDSLKAAFEKQMLAKHLKISEEKGQIKREGKKWVLV